MARVSGSSRAPARVLVVSHEADAARDLVAFLGGHGYSASFATDGERGSRAIEREPVDALVSELHAPAIDGLALLDVLREHRPGACAVFVTERPELERAVEAMRRGAWDVLARPTPSGRLLEVLRRGLEHRALVAKISEIEGQLDRRLGLDALAGRSRAIERVRDVVRRIAPTNATVILEGERGTGKELVAHAIHRASRRRDGPFVGADCAALPPELLRAEWLGESGPRGGEGIFVRAHGGTLFLDHVEALGIDLQMLLLRVLQDREVPRADGPGGRPVDVRLVVSSERDLQTEVREQRFYPDLYWRLSVVHIVMPPLRERRDDLPALTEGLLRDLAREHRRRPRALTAGVMERLRAYDWPGNVSELKSVLEGMIVSARGRGPLDVSGLPPRLRDAHGDATNLAIEVGMTVAEAERALIEATLRQVEGDKPRAAAMLGIGLRTLYRKLSGA